MCGDFGVLPSLVRFFADPTLLRYVVSAAYLDASGADLLRVALSRGASVTLVVPSSPNVYAHANNEALTSLIRDGGGWGTALRVRRLMTSMLHAKAAVGIRRNGSQVAFCGSANLKKVRKRPSTNRHRCIHASSHDSRASQRSFSQFGELVVFADGGIVARRLGAALASLASQAVLLRAEYTELRYEPTWAAVEAWCG